MHITIYVHLTPIQTYKKKQTIYKTQKRKLDDVY